MDPELIQPPQELPEIDALLIQNDQHHDEQTQQLDTLIAQNEKNNPEPILEASLVEQAKASESLEKIEQNTQPKERQKIELVDATEDEGQLSRALWQMLRGQKGEKGDKGDQGEKGDTGADSTVEGPMGPQGPEGEEGPYGPQGPQGERGRDGRDGIDGKDGKDGARGPKGERGPEGSSDTGEEIVSKVSALNGDSRLSYKALRDTPDIFKGGSSRDYTFTELKDAPNSYAGKGGQFVKVKSDETGLEFGTGGSGGSSGAVVAGGALGSLPQGMTLFLGRENPRDAEVPLFIATAAQTITRLDVLSLTANGSGHTDTYAVVKNGVVQSMVVAITNDDAGSTTLNPVSLVAGDRVAIRVVSDALTAAADIIAQLTITS